MNDNGSSTGVLVGILIVVVIGLVAWFAYSQGYFKAKEQKNDGGSLQINLGGSSDQK